MVCDSCKASEAALLRLTSELHKKERELADVSAKYKKGKLQSKAKVTQLRHELKQLVSDEEKDSTNYESKISRLLLDLDESETSLLQCREELDELKVELSSKDTQINDHQIRIRTLEEQLELTRTSQASAILALEEKGRTSSPDRKLTEKEQAETLKDAENEAVKKVHAQLVYKDTRILELNNLVLDKDRQILDLQELCREKDEVTAAKNRAIQIMHEQLLEKTKETKTAATETSEDPKISNSPSLPLSIETDARDSPPLHVDNSQLTFHSPGRAVAVLSPRGATPPPVDPAFEDQSSLTTESAPELLDLYRGTLQGDVADLEREEERKSLRLLNAEFSDMLEQFDTIEVKFEGPTDTEGRPGGMLESKLITKKRKKRVTFDLSEQERNSEMRELKEQIKDLEISCQELREENEELRATIADQEGSVETAKRGELDWELQCKLMSAKVEELQSEIEEAKKDVRNSVLKAKAHSQSRIKELENEVVELQNKIDAYDGRKVEIRNLEDRINELNTDLTAAKAAYIELEEKHACELQQLKVCLQDENDSLVQELEDSKEELKSLEIENEELRDQLVSAEQNLQEIKLDYQDLLHQHESVFENVAPLKETVETSNELIIELESKNQLLKSAISDLEKNLDTTKDELIKAQQTADTLLEEKNNVLADIDELREAIEMSQQVIQHLEMDLQVAQTEAEVLREHLGEIRNEKIEVTSELIKESTAKKLTGKAYATKLKILERENEELSHASAGYHLKWRAFDAKIRVMENEKSELERKLNEKTNECEELKASSDHLLVVEQQRKENYIFHLKAQIDVFRMEFDQCKKINESLVEEKSEIEMELQDLWKKETDLKRHLGESEAACNRLREERAEMVVQIEELSQGESNLTYELNKLSGKHKELQLKCNRLNDKVAVLESDASQETKNLATELQKLKDHFDSLEEGNASLKHQVKHLSAVKADLSQDKLSLQKQVTELKQELQSFQHNWANEKSELMSDIEQWRAKNIQQELIATDASNKLIAVQLEMEKRGSELSELMIKSEAIQEKASNLQQQLDADLSQDKLSLQKQVTELKQELQTFQHNWANEKSELMSDIEQWRAKNVQQELIATDASNKLIAVQWEMEKRDSELNELMIKCEAIQEKASNLQQQLDAEKKLTSEAQKNYTAEFASKEDLKSKYDDLEHLLAKTMSENSKLTDKISNVELELHARTAQQAELNESLEKNKVLESEVSAVKAVLHSMVEHFNQEGVEERAFQDQLQVESESERNELQKQLETLQSKLQMTIVLKNEEIIKLHSENSTLNAKTSELQNKVLFQSEIISSLKEEILDLQNVCTSTRNTAEAMKDNLIQERGQLETKCVSQEGELNVAKENIKELTGEKERLQHQLTSTVDKLEKTEAELITLKQQLSESKEQELIFHETQEQMLDSLKSQNEELLSTITLQKSNLTQLNIKVSELSGQLEEYKSLNERLQQLTGEDSCDVEAQEHQDVKIKLKEALFQIDTLEKDKIKLTEDRYNLCEEVVSLNNKLKHAEDQVEAQCIVVTGLNQSISDLIKVNEDLEKKCSTVEQKCNNNEHKMLEQNVNEKIATLEEENLLLRHCLNDAEQTLKEDADRIEELDILCTAQKGVVRKLREQIHQLEQMIKTEIANVLQDKSAVSEELLTQSIQMDEAFVEIRNKLREVLQKAEDNRTQLELEVTGAQTSLQQVNEEKQSLQLKFDELSQYNLQIQSAYGDLYQQYSKQNCVERSDKGTSDFVEKSDIGTLTVGTEFDSRENKKELLKLRAKIRKLQCSLSELDSEKQKLITDFNLQLEQARASFSSEFALKVSELHNSLKNLRMAKEAVVKEIEQNKTCVVSEISAVCKQCDALKFHCLKIDTEVKELEKGVLTERESCSKLESTNLKLLNQINDYKATSELQAEEIVALKNLCLQATKEKDILTSENTVLEHKLTQMKKYAGSLNDEISELNTKCSELSNRLVVTCGGHKEEVDEQKQLLLQKNQELENGLQLLCSEKLLNQELFKKLEVAEELVAKTNAQLQEACQVHISELQTRENIIGEKEDLLRHIKELKEQIVKNEATIMDLSNTVEVSHAEISAQQDQYKENTRLKLEVDTLSEKCEQFESARSAVEHAGAHLEHRVMDLEKLCSEMDKENSDLREQIENITAEKEDVHRHSKQLEEQIVKNEAVITDLNDTIKAFHAEVSVQKDQQEENTGLKLEVDTLSEKCARSVVENANENLEHRVMGLKKLCSEIDKENTGLKEQVESITAEKEGLLRQLQEQTVKNETIIADLNSTIQALHVEVAAQKGIHEENTRLKLEVDSLSGKCAQFANARSVMEDAIGPLEHRVMDLEELCSHADKEKADLKQQVENITVEKENMLTHSQQLEDQILRNEAIIIDLNNTIEVLHAEVSVQKDQQEENTRLKLEVDTLSEKYAQFESARSTMEDASAHLKTRVVDLEKLHSEMHKEKTDLKEQLEHITAEKEDIQRHSKQLEEQIVKNETIIADLNNTIQALHVDVAAQKGQHEVNTKLQLEVDSLSEKCAQFENLQSLKLEELCSENDKEKASLKECIDFQKTQITALICERDDLKAQVQSMDDSLLLKEDLFQKLTHLEASCDKIKTEREKLIGQMQELETQLSKSESEKDSLKQNVHNIMKKSESSEFEFCARIEALKTELDGAEETIVVLKGEKSQMAAVIDDLKEKLSQCEEDRKSLNTENKMLQSRLEKALQEDADWHGKVSTLTATLETVEHNLEHSLMENETLQTEKNSACQKFYQYEQAKLCLENDIASLMAFIKEVTGIETSGLNVTELMQQMNSARVRLSEKNEEYSELALQLQTAEEIKRHLKQDIMDRQVEIGELKSDVETMKQSLKLKEEALFSANCEANVTVEFAEKVKNLFVGMFADIHNGDFSKKSWIEIADLIEIQFIHLKKTVNEKEALLEELQQNVVLFQSQWEAALHQRDEFIGQTMEKLQTVTQKLNDEQMAVKVLSQQYNDVVAEKEKANIFIEELKQERSEVKSEWECLKAQLEKLDVAKDETMSLRKDKESLQLQLRLATESNESLKQKVAETEGFKNLLLDVAVLLGVDSDIDLISLTDSLNNKVQDLGITEQKLQDSLKEITDLNSKIQIDEQLKQQVHFFQENAASLEADNQKLQNELVEMKDTLCRQKNEMEKANLDHFEQHASFIGNYEKLKVEYGHLKEKMDSDNCEWAAQRDLLASQRRKLSEENQEIKQQILDIQGSTESTEITKAKLEEKVQLLTAELNLERSEKEQFKTDCLEAEELCKQLYQKIEKLQAEMGNDEFNKAKEDNCKMKLEVEHWKTQNSVLQEQLDIVSLEFSQFRGKYAADCDKLINEKISLEEKVKELQRLLSDLQQQLEEVETDLSNKQNCLNKSSLEIESLQKSLHELKGDLQQQSEVTGFDVEKVQKEKEALQAEYSELRTRFDQMDSEKRRLTSDCIHYDDEIAALKEQCAQFSTSIDDKAALLCASEEKLAEENKHRIIAENVAMMAQQKEQAAEEENIRLETALSETLSANEKLNGEFLSCKEKLLRLEVDYETQKTMFLELEDAKQQCEQMLEDQDKVEQTFKKHLLEEKDGRSIAEAKSKQLLESLDEIRKEKRILESDLKGALEISSTLEAELAEVRHSATEYKRQKELEFLHLQQQYDSLHKEFQSVKEVQKVLEEQYAASKIEKNSLQTEINHLKMSLESKVEENDVQSNELRNVIEVLQLEISGLKAKEEEMTQAATDNLNQAEEYSKLQKKHLAVEQEALTQKKRFGALKLKLKHSEQEKLALQQNAALLQEEKVCTEQQLKETQQAIVELQLVVRNLQADAAALKKEETRLQQAVMLDRTSELQEELKTITQSRDDAWRQLGELREQISQYSRNMESYKLKLAERDVMVDKLKESECRSETLLEEKHILVKGKQDLQEALAELKAALEQSEHDRSELKEKLLAANDQLTMVTTRESVRTSELLQQLERLQSQLEEAELNQQQLNEEIMRKRNESLTTNLDSEVDGSSDMVHMDTEPLLETSAVNDCGSVSISCQETCQEILTSGFSDHLRNRWASCLRRIRYGRNCGSRQLLLASRWLLLMYLVALHVAVLYWWLI